MSDDFTMGFVNLVFYGFWALILLPPLGITVAVPTYAIRECRKRRAVRV